VRNGRASRVGVLSAALAVLLSACGGSSDGSADDDGRPAIVTDLSPSSFNGTLVESLAMPRQPLTDISGKPFSLTQRPEDEVTVLFFGYTHCPDVCPTTMADLAAARAAMPAELQERIQVVFVTEDPARDTNPALRRWLDRYDPSFIGLQGGNKTSHAWLNQLYLPGTKTVEHPEKSIQHPHTDDGQHHDHGEYGIEHSSVVYAFGPTGDALIYTAGATPSEYAADFTQLLEQDPGSR
jgi:protein SCO1/2